MKKFKILFIFLVLFISVSAVHADGNFTSLQTEINNAGDSIEITRDYIYDNSTDFGLKNGISPFYGYHTVRLTSEIPVKENDNFTVIMKKDFVPILEDSRMHYEKNTVFIQHNGTWADLALESKTATLKVYTKNLAIYTEDLVKIYKNASKFEANVGAANENVTFEINGVNYTRVSDENGTLNWLLTYIRVTTQSKHHSTTHQLKIISLFCLH